MRSAASEAGGAPGRRELVALSVVHEMALQRARAARPRRWSTVTPMCRARGVLKDDLHLADTVAAPHVTCTVIGVDHGDQVARLIDRRTATLFARARTSGCVETDAQLFSE